MQRLTNFEEVHAVLRKFYGKHGAWPYTLERMRELMAYVDNPQDKLQVVHVAGTSGKTSTAYFIASLLKESGAKVGLTVSPHVDEVNERVQIGLIPQPEAQFCQEIAEFLDIVDKSGILPSYFECMVAFAYWEFARQQVDYAVVEVGLGGLLDGTNVVTRHDKVCVITDIGLDHTELLGETMGEIAVQKAGIIQPGNQAFMFLQDEEVMQAVQQAISHAKGSELHIVPQLSTCKVDDLPLFQERNFCLAQAVVGWLLQQGSKPDLSESQLQQAAQVHIPGRMETIVRDGKTIIVDGAHNYQKLQTLLESVHAKYPEQAIAVLAGFVEGNDSRLQQSLDVLATHAEYLIATTFYTEKDYPRHSFKSSVITKYLNAKGKVAVEAVDNTEAALQTLLQRQEPILLITGSFYLLNHIRPLLIGARHD